MSFPETKYMGSKRLLLPFILESIRKLPVSRVLDAFSGSGCVAYALKQQGVEVHANDFLRFAFTIAHATVENNSTTLTRDDLRHLMSRNLRANNFVASTFRDLYFDHDDDQFLDSLWTNISELSSRYKRSLALAAACRAAQKKRPRGIFTFTGKKGWDDRRDLKLSMAQQFINAATAFNAAVFSNRKRNKAFNQDVFDLDPKGYDLVYIDTPYVSPFSDCDYTRRYHFLEGYCSYWRDTPILTNTLTKKIKTYPTAFASKNDVVNALSRLFYHFRHSVLVLSYSSNGIPSKQQMVSLLRQVKQTVDVVEHSHRYSSGNHNHKIGDNKNSVHEYLFIAR